MDVQTTPDMPVDKKTRTRQQILQAALTCFAQKGYHQTSMDDIVSASGLSKGALYWHFNSKQDLFIALMEWFFQQISDDVAHAWRDGMSAADRLRAMTRATLKDSERLIPFFKLFLDFWAQTPEDERLASLLERTLTEFQQQISAVIEDGIAAGEFKPVNAPMIALSLFGVLDSLFLYRTLLGEKIDMYTAAETAVETLIAGLTCKE
ncbi:MAG: TetR/AcrR family transcriptional regulator [Chloroflexi bacterium]|nr:MAG: TetR/AcrR family transcriptional regulator [Chloroflexota bacterium]